MARPARGHEFLNAAITQAGQAKTISELRMAQALLLPLKFGLSLDDTSVVVGRSKSWTLRLRTRFGRIQSGQEQPKTKKGLRNRARMTLEEEAAILAPYLEQAKQGGRDCGAAPESEARTRHRATPGRIDGVRHVASARLAQAGT